MENPIKVLLVDDSLLVRSLLKQGLERFGDISIVGGASDPYEASEMIAQNRPDVIALDIEMPKMNGIEFLKYIMSQLPIPVIMVSSLSERGKQITMDALSYGAFDFITKPLAHEKDSFTKMLKELHSKIVAASTIIPRKLLLSNNDKAYEIVDNPAISFRRHALVVIGASTGGTEAIRNILERLPVNFPPILITQHMSLGFTSLFASRLNDVCKIRVKEAVHGEKVISGTAYIAPGGFQMGLTKGHEDNIIFIEESEPVNGHAPSVGFLFNSVAKYHDLTAVILTGMGKDGSSEIVQLKNNGAFTIAQNEETSVVYGMPGEAVRNGGICAILPVQTIAETLIQKIKE